MMDREPFTSNTATLVLTSPEWQTGNLGYRCEFRIVADETSGFWGYMPKLPGVISQGETFDECVLNMVDAASAAIGSYLGDGSEIPWRDPDTSYGGTPVWRGVVPQ